VQVGDASEVIPVDRIDCSDISDTMITREEQAYLDRDFSVESVSRTSAEKFSSRQRGSIRLSKSLFRTEDEQADYVEAALAIRLPGVRGA
jgi:hypothetical protein